MQDLLYERARAILLERGVAWEEKKMMGGITFMVHEKMCFGGFQGGLLCRIDPAARTSLLERPGAEIVRQGGREMKGYVLVQPFGFESYAALEFWVGECLRYNPQAKSRKQKGAS